jgi:broad specificity phosphatase PhoE
MELDALPPPDHGSLSERPGAGRSDGRSLDHLRDRVEAAAREIERLRSENAALAQRVLELQDARDGKPSFSFGEGEDTGALKARVQGFIDAIDDLLSAEGAAARPTGTDAPDDR